MKEITDAARHGFSKSMIFVFARRFYEKKNTDAARHGYSKSMGLFLRDDFMVAIVARLYSRRKKNNFDSYVHRNQTDEKQN